MKYSSAVEAILDNSMPHAVEGFAYFAAAIAAVAAVTLFIWNVVDCPREAAARRRLTIALFVVGVVLLPGSITIAVVNKDARQAALRAPCPGFLDAVAAGQVRTVSQEVQRAVEFACGTATLHAHANSKASVLRLH